MLLAYQIFHRSFATPSNTTVHKSFLISFQHRNAANAVVINKIINIIPVDERESTPPIAPMNPNIRLNIINCFIRFLTFTYLNVILSILRLSSHLGSLV